MVWGKFGAKLEYRRNRHAMTQYLPGKRYFVPQGAIDAAKEKGIEFVETERRGDAPAASNPAASKPARGRNAGGGK